MLEHLSEVKSRCSPGGIGHALALEFQAQGLRVFATARTTEAVQDLADAGIEALDLDVTSEKSISACKEEVAKSTGGRLDYLVNNAGRSSRTSDTSSLGPLTEDQQTTPSQLSKLKYPRSKPHSTPTSSP